MAQTSEFMFLFRFEPNNAYQPTETEMAAQHQAWGAFIGTITLQEKLVSTHQLGFEGRQIFADTTTQPSIHIANNVTLGGNMVVRAYSFDDAVEMARNCPILSVGGSVEVRGVVPMG